MSTHNIQFHDKIRKYPEIFVLMNYRKNFVGTQTRVQITHGKRAIGVRAIEARLYLVHKVKKKWPMSHMRARNAKLNLRLKLRCLIRALLSTYRNTGYGRVQSTLVISNSKGRY